MNGRSQAGFRDTISPMFLGRLCGLLLLPIAAVAQTGTVPLILEENVPMIDLEFVRPDGTMQTGRFVVDSGGGAFVLTEKLANSIGLKPSGPVRKAEGAEFASANPPQVRVGGMPLDLKDARVMIQYGNDRLEERDAVDGLFPGHVLKRYHVIFDYPARKFTLAAPGSVTPRGTAVPSPVRAQNGFARLELSIGGRTVGVLLDTGASFTMISRTAIEEWSSAAAPPWPRLVGAVGPANMGARSDPAALVVRLPELRLGGFVIDHAGAVSRENGTYEKLMSGEMVAPIIGALGGNVLRQFRVEIDYAAGVTYFERAGRDDPADMELVGLTLSVAPDQSVRVTAVSSAADAVAREQIKPGDRLRSVDGISVSGLSLMQIVQRLRGKPGDRKELDLERDGKPIQVQAAVTRLL
jgi:PDZ domain/Aspartyl protease